MAIAIPPRVIVLIVAPNPRSASTAAASDNGIAVSVRGERPLKQGQKLLMGDHTMRVEAL